MIKPLLFRIQYLFMFAHRSNSHHHHGPSPERNSGLFQLSCRQPESFPLPHPVHPGGGGASIMNHREFCHLLFQHGRHSFFHHFKECLFLGCLKFQTSSYWFLRSQTTGTPSSLQSLLRLLRGSIYSSSVYSCSSTKGCKLYVCVSVCLRAQSYAERLRLGLAVMHGEAHNFELVMSDSPQLTLSTGLTRTHTGLELPRKPSQAAECLLMSSYLSDEWKRAWSLVLCFSDDAEGETTYYRCWRCGRPNRHHCCKLSSFTITMFALWVCGKKRKTCNCQRMWKCECEI